MSLPASFPGRLVFTDLDGSLLDHHTYSFAPAAALLAELEQRGIPVIAASSKTQAEWQPLARELDNSHPFIAENGAAIYIPAGYFPHQPAGTRLLENYWLYETSRPRQHWLELLEALRPEFGSSFLCFREAGTAGIARMTGLSQAQAERANQRQYSEPLQWQGTDQDLQDFTAALQAAGATVQRGGRFLSVGGDCDKGRALRWLQARYEEQFDSGICHSLAVGDGPNDISMLQAADIALLIRSPVNDLPNIERSGYTMTSEQFGPHGWNEGVRQWLALDLTEPPEPISTE
jgi:mannosyl-3-phosphoglycerate phosphatase family protein